MARCGTWRLLIDVDRNLRQLAVAAHREQQPDGRGLRGHGVGDADGEDVHREEGDHPAAVAEAACTMVEEGVADLVVAERLAAAGEQRWPARSG